LTIKIKIIGPIILNYVMLLYYFIGYLERDTKSYPTIYTVKQRN